MRVNSPENSGNQPQQPTEGESENLQGRDVSSEPPPGSERVPMPTTQVNIPENLNVSGSLDLNDCTRLTSLPENLSVGGHLDLAGCTGERDVFASLDEAFEFWNGCIPEEKRSQNPNLSVDPHSLVSVCTFLTSLTNTADYQNKAAQPVLAQRVIDLLKLMSEDKKISELACELIHHGQTSCDDRLITAMDELELMVRVHNTEGEQNLRDLAKGIVMLEKVQQRARAHMKTLQRVDEIEVVLAFQIALKEKLDLPLSTENMIFRSRAQISDAAIQKAGDEIKAEVTDADVKKYLKDWDPWQKHLRKKQIKSFDELKEVKQEDLSAICALTLSPLAELEQPIRYGNNVYEYDAFVKAFIKSGLDPSNRQPIDFKAVRRCGISSGQG